MPLARAAALVLLVALSGCGAGDALFGSDDATESAYAVFLTRADCPYLVANLTRSRFAVLAPTAERSFRQGDLLVGNLRDGGAALDIVPVGASETERRLSFNVVGRDLSLAEAQALYYGRCPLPASASPPGTPGLPLAPEDVPAGVPPDSTGAR